MAVSGGTGGIASTATIETFIIDPFAGDINPGTTRGQKLFTEACSALNEADKLTASVENQHVVMEHIMSLVQKFRWGPQVLAVKLASDLTTTKSIITESHALSLEDFKVQAYKIWGGGLENASSIPVHSATNRCNLILTDLNVTAASTNQEKSIFYARVRSTMIRRAIEGHYSVKTLKNLRLQRKDYEWRNPTTGFVEEDGATMLKIIIDIIKPSLKVGLRRFKDVITTATAKKYNEDPIEMLNTMESAYDEITIKRNKTHDTYMSDLFEALKTFKNKVFVDFITRHEDAWEADASDDTPAKIDSFILTVRTKYNNMKDRELWDIVDPANAKILALTTQLASVEKQLADAKVHTAAPNAGAFLTEKKSTLV